MAENKNVVKEIKELELPVFIWGNGSLGDLSQRVLNENGVYVTGFVVDNEYIAEEGNANVWSKHDLEEKFESYVIVKAILSKMTVDDEKIKQYFKNCIKVYSLVDTEGVAGIEKIDGKYYQENKIRFDKVRDALVDQFSKDSIDAFIRAEIEDNNSYIYPYVITPKYYFETDYWQFQSDEILIDGGAFDGDSIRDFLERTNRQYKKIYACEPDADNMIALVKNVKMEALPNVELIAKGLYSRTDILQFDFRGDMMSQIIDKNVEKGNKLEVDSIDNILNGTRASIIKMDIEGSEMEALKGAKATICNYHPLLFISAYHKRSDLFMIYEYILSLYDKYKFFFRIHKPYAGDAVLYAIPEERMLK